MAQARACSVPTGVITPIACALYCGAIVVANGLIALFGPWISLLNSFVLIGADLALRDWLQLRLTRMGMALLIAGAGVLTWALNAAPARIALASAVAFSVAALADWFTFSATTGSWFKRSNASNVVGAGFDSVIFPSIAFGEFLPVIVGLQFAAKVAGGAAWAWVLRRR